MGVNVQHYGTFNMALMVNTDLGFNIWAYRLW